MRCLIVLTLTSSVLLIGCQRRYYDPDWIYAHLCIGGCLNPSPKLTYYDKINKKTHIYCLRTLSVRPTWAESPDFRIKAYNTRLLNPELGEETYNNSIPSFFTTNNFSSDSIIYSYAQKPVFLTLQPLINLSQKEGMRTYSGDAYVETLKKGYDQFGIMTYEFSYFYKHALYAKYTYSNAAGLISIKFYDAGALVTDNVLLKIDELALNEYLRQSSPTSLLLFGCPDTVQAEIKIPPKKRKHR